MALLDRFRSLPGHKHPDPGVRLEYVEALSLDEREQLRAAAREDENPRIRRAAVGKLMEPSTLALVARDDSDEGVRAHATSMLRDIALEVFEETGEADSLAAVEALSDAKVLSHIAKTTTRQAVAERALARLTDPRARGSVARRAVLESIRRAAFDSLTGRDDFIAVAMNSGFKDTAILAVERLSDRVDLEQIVERSNNKNAVKRARGILRDMDERAAQEAAAAAPPAPGPAQEPSAADELEIARQREAEKLGEAQARDVEARARAEAESAREREERLAAERAVADAAAAEESRKQAERRHERLVELVAEIESAASDQDLQSARRRHGLAQREWRDLTSSAGADADLAERCADAETRLTAREHDAREADRRARLQALSRTNQWLARIEALVVREDLSAKAAERALRDLRAAQSEVPPLPSRQDYDEVIRRLKAAQAALTPKLQELRELEGWQRWANVGIQEQLCEKMEALALEPNPEEIARRIRDLQQQWRQAADVPRAQGVALWQRFKKAHDEMWARCEAHFAAEAERRAENLQKRIALCERAEAAADSTRWIQTAEEIKALQAEWKTIGPVSRGQEKAVWERFRAACDRFFTRRHEDLAQRKTVWAENLAKKDALCAKAEALADSTDWDAAAAEIKRLQAEWKTIGAVKKSRSEAIWQRFRSACDRFFLRYAQRHEIARGERVAAREAICAELESLDSEEDLLTRVRSLRARWQQDIAQRGIEPARAAALDQRFAAAFERVLATWPQAFANTDLDPDANRRKMEALVTRIEQLASSLRGPSPGGDDALSPTTRLAEMLKEALAANTIGGKVDHDSRLRAAQEDVRQAQAGWSRIGPVPEPARRALADRFQRASRLITEAVSTDGAGRAGGTGGAGGAGGAGKAGGARRDDAR
jgi:hypothetical protein